MRNDGNLDDPCGLDGPAVRLDDNPSTDQPVSAFRRWLPAGFLRTRLSHFSNLFAARRGRARMAVATGAVCCLGLAGVAVIGASPAGESFTPDQRAEIAQRAEADAASRGRGRESAAPVTESPTAESRESSALPTAKSTPKAKATSKPKPKRVVPVAGLDQAQMNNAKMIVRAGEEMDVPRRALVIAVATAMQESNLYNYASGVLPESQNYPHQAIGWDHDSVGLFQQRPSTGWGAVRDLMKPEYATRQFLSALLAIPGWQDLPLTVAAQSVQVSAFGWLYAQHEWRANQVVNAILA
ncbi:peptidase M23 [Micromonospora sp. WMMC250]|uniref:peptidase M23 n=1 Tax=Micromonospora sp. WMMC250 TaxID=3014781 RepID=UPI0022B6F8BB|nr:peptidase M23 [Micromonospora sp. WMMC250]MCZ7379822.1 peptidase M23 [Micromonospora sp. WMMC250]